MRRLLVQILLGALALTPCVNSSAVQANTPKAASGENEAEIERLQLEQRRLLEEVREAISRLPAEPDDEAALTAEERAQLLRRRELVQLLAEIERRVAEGGIERVRYISRATSAQPYKGYLERFQRRVEEAGTKDFPRAEGASVYGDVLLSVSINPSGKVLKIDIHRSSSDVLTQHTVRLLKSLEPFERYGAKMGRKLDHLVLTVPFSYRND